MASRRRLAWVVAVAASLVAVDQLTKTWAVNALAHRDIDVFWTLRLNLTFNFGSAFSISWGRWVPLVAVLGVGVVVLLLRLSAGTTRRPALVAVGLVIGGSLGNLADRAFRAGPPDGDRGFMGGGVVDFVDLQWWPIFNVADAAIVVGAILLVLTGNPGGDDGTEEPATA